MRNHQTRRTGPARGRSGALVLALTALTVVPMASGDTFRVKTDHGIFLVDAEGPDVTVRGDGDDLIITRGGDEYRLKLTSFRDDVSSKEPLLAIRREGKVIVSARRLAVASASAPPAASVPGRTILNPRALTSAWSLAMTPDGRTMVSGHVGFLRVWDPSTMSERFNVSIGKVARRVAITPDGSTIASAEYTQADGKTTGNVAIRDGKTGAIRREMAAVPNLHAVAIDPAGKVAVSGSWSETNVRVWDVVTGEQIGTLKGHSGSVGEVRFSPDGKMLASCGDTTVRFWDVDTGKILKVLRGHQDTVESFAFSADGKTIASCGFDDDARVWDVETGKILATMQADNPVLAVALTADGKTLATASARWGNGFYRGSPAQVQVWDVATGKPVSILPEQPAQVFSMIFKPDGKSLFTASLSGAVTLWDVAKFPLPEEASKSARPSNR
jgi:WD40 repeat protein